MAVVPADLTVDLDHLAEVTGSQRAELASEWEFKDRFADCEAGAMPPFGHLYGLPVFVADALAEDEFIDDAATVGELGPEKEGAKVKRSRLYEYSFPEQEFGIKVDDVVECPVTEQKVGTVVEVRERLERDDTRLWRRAGRSRFRTPWSQLPARAGEARRAALARAIQGRGLPPRPGAREMRRDCGCGANGFSVPSGWGPHREYEDRHRWAFRRDRAGRS